MHIDCATCPGRPRSCDGCMMTVFVGLPTSVNSTDGLRSVPAPAAFDVDAVRDAVEVFVGLGLVGPSARREPIVTETRGHDSQHLADVRELRAG